MVMKFLAAGDGNSHLVSRFPTLLEQVIDGQVDDVPFPSLTGRTLELTFYRTHNGQGLLQGFTREAGLDHYQAQGRCSDVEFLATVDGLRAWAETLRSDDGAANVEAIRTINCALVPVT